MAYQTQSRVIPCPTAMQFRRQNAAYFNSIDAEMRAFDSLPVEIRRVLANSKGSTVATEVAEDWAEESFWGTSPQQYAIRLQRRLRQFQ